MSMALHGPVQVIRLDAGVLSELTVVDVEAWAADMPTLSTLPDDAWPAQPAQQCTMAALSNRLHAVHHDTCRASGHMPCMLLVSE